MIPNLIISGDFNICHQPIDIPPRWRERHARAQYVEKTIKQAFLIWSPAENSRVVFKSDKPYDINNFLMSTTEY